MDRKEQTNDGHKRKKIRVVARNRPRGKESTNKTSKGKERETLLPKIEEISNGKAHTNTWKFNQQTFFDEIFSRNFLFLTKFFQ